MGKADLLRAELDVAEAEEALVAAKAARSECSECGRLRAGSAEEEALISELKADVREKRRRFREARRG